MKFILLSLVCILSTALGGCSSFVRDEGDKKGKPDVNQRFFYDRGPAIMPDKQVEISGLF
jgi:hypothetical protein